MNLEDLKIKDGEEIINPGLNVLDRNEMFANLLEKIQQTEYNEGTINGILESLKIEGENIVSSFMHYVDFEYPIFPQIQGVPLRGAAASVGMGSAASVGMGSAASVGMVAGNKHIRLLFENKIRNLIQRNGDNFDSYYSNIPGFNDIIYFCNENLTSVSLPRVEEGLDNPGENRCYLNSLLHFLYPILIDIQNKTDNGVRLHSLHFNVIDTNYKPEYNNIVQFIITLLQNQSFQQRSKGVGDIVRSFINMEIIQNRTNPPNLQIRQRPDEPYQSGRWSEPNEVLIHFFENLRNLGYCTTFSYDGIIKMKLYMRDHTFPNHIEDQNYQTSAMKVIVKEQNYNLEEVIRKSLFEEIEKTEYEEFKGYSLDTYVNILLGNLPDYLILFIDKTHTGIVRQIRRKQEEIKKGRSEYTILKELNETKYKIGNITDRIQVLNDVFEITDIICNTHFSGSHYISFNKRIKNERGETGWYGFNDSIRAGPYLNDEQARTEINKNFIRMILLKKIPRA